MVSSKGAGGAINSFIKRRQGGRETREQETPHTQRDMRGISPAICHGEGMASIYFFQVPCQILFELVNRNEEAGRRYAIQQCCWQLEDKEKSEEHQPNPKASLQGLQANRQIQQ